MVTVEPFQTRPGGDDHLGFTNGSRLRFARRLGIDEVAAEVMPAHKASAVEQFQAGGKRVAMVGDGVDFRRRQ
jgi:high-affinity K+ transport system ATPase subunit B